MQRVAAGALWIPKARLQGTLSKVAAAMGLQGEDGGSSPLACERVQLNRLRRCDAQCERLRRLRQTGRDETHSRRAAADLRLL